MQKISARRLAAGKHLGLLVAVLAGKQHLPKQAADLFVRRRRIPLVQPLEYRHALLDQRPMILREVSHRRLVSPDDFAGIRNAPS